MMWSPQSTDVRYYNRAAVATVQILSIAFLLRRPPVARASAAGDDCSADLPCAPAESDSLFCDYKISAAVGGYCVACEGRDIFSCEDGLNKAAVADCEDKCTFKNCTEPCPDGFFCSLQNHPDGPCWPCDDTVKHPEDCSSWFLIEEGEKNCVDSCQPQPCSHSRHCLSISSDPTKQFFCNFDASASNPDSGGGGLKGTCGTCSGLWSIEDCRERTESELGFQECAEVCKEAIIAPCETNDDCRNPPIVVDDAALASKERVFCNGATCQVCPGVDSGDEEWHVEQCFDSKKMNLSAAASENCAESCHSEFFDITKGTVSVGALVEYVGNETNIPMYGTPYTTASGPLVDCQLGGEGACPPALPGFVCLISRGTYTFVTKVLNCEEAGGVAAIVYDSDPDAVLFTTTLGNAGTFNNIPATFMSMEDGLYMLDNGLGLETTVKSERLGVKTTRGCSERIACPSSPSSQYCDFELETGTGGYCQECSPDEDAQRFKCFLSGLTLKGAVECAETCGSTLTASSCKICGEGISSKTLKRAAEGEDRCNFCPDGLKKSYWDRKIPFVGGNATCFKLNQFFLNYDIAEDSPNCQLALGFNYICDCEGPGYAGADTVSKRGALVWVPRVSAVLSFLGSLAIIIEVVKHRDKRTKVYFQLMFAMSIFDLVGSVAYSLTTLPIPKEFFVEGAKGNDATCKAQGFFIQIGTTSAFINVSLAAYYYCIIILEWSDTKVKKFRLWFFVLPITIGLAFAFAGIFFYDMLFLWCNNTEKFWPDIPVVIAILITTCVMGRIVYYVFKIELASRTRARRTTATTTGRRTRAFLLGQSRTARVFRQSIRYLLSFYLTWVPYLALQYSWAAGTGYSNYSLALAAGMLVPLQGFWNSANFFRKRLLKSAVGISSHFTGIRSQVSEHLSRAGSSVQLRGPKQQSSAVG